MRTWKHCLARSHFVTRQRLALDCADSSVFVRTISMCQCVLCLSTKRAHRCLRRSDDVQGANVTACPVQFIELNVSESQNPGVTGYTTG